VEFSKNKLTILIIILAANHASAYIDPGTGGMIVGGAGNIIWTMLLVILGGITAFVVKFYGAIKMRILGLWKGKRR